MKIGCVKEIKNNEFRVGLTPDNVRAYVAAHPGEVFNRDFLITRFWGADADTSDNTLTIAMFKLREKLGPEGSFIRTIRGVGYVYRPGVG